MNDIRTAKTRKPLDVEALEAELDEHEVDPSKAVDATPLRDLADLVHARRSIDEQITSTIAAARKAGISWGYIAEILGVSRQAARQKYDELVDDQDSYPCGFPRYGTASSVADFIWNVSHNDAHPSDFVVFSALNGVAIVDQIALRNFSETVKMRVPAVFVKEQA